MNNLRYQFKCVKNRNN